MWIHFEVTLGSAYIFTSFLYWLSLHIMSAGATPGNTFSPSSSSAQDTGSVLVHDYSDPLYLHPSDSSNTALITCVLTGCDNYAIWSRAMRFSLSRKNKLNFVEGLILMPNEPDLAEKWNKCNSVIMSWLLNSVDKTIYSSLLYYNKASDVWRNLKQTYSKIDGTGLYSIVQETSRLSQGNDSVSSYYMKLKLL